MKTLLLAVLCIVLPCDAIALTPIERDPEETFSRIAFSSALLGSHERWGPVYEAGDRLYAVAGRTVLRFDIDRGQWKVLQAQDKSPPLKIHTMGGDGASVYIGGRYEDGTPLLWKVDRASEKVEKLPIADALEKAGLKEYDAVRFRPLGDVSG